MKTSWRRCRSPTSFARRLPRTRPTGRRPQAVHSRSGRRVVDLLSHAEGWETYDYDWTEHPELDSSKSLDLLKHVGGNPIAALVDRSKFSPEGYDMLVKWIGVGYRYFEEYGLPQIESRRNGPNSTRSSPK